jgi:hypothetical protein
LHIPNNPRNEGLPLKHQERLGCAHSLGFPSGQDQPYNYLGSIFWSNHRQANSSRSDGERNQAESFL